jgi:hypothetical protein
LIAFAGALIAACQGPETGDDRDPTPTPTATASATPTEIPPTATATPEPTATNTPTPTVTATPTEPSGSPATGSPAGNTGEPRDRLPLLSELPGEGYTITEEGTRTAQELANAYADPAAHLRRLDEWGFKRHAYRAFVRTPSGPDDPLPPSILATINEYGSDEQAENALQWLLRLAMSQGATEVEPPRIGDNAVAITLPTADNVPTASLYVRQGPYIYVYFAEGGDPGGAVAGIGTRVFGR